MGSTTRTLHTRMSKHCGLSYRTGLPLSHPTHSNIWSHAETCGSLVSFGNFTLMDYTNHPVDLRILESTLYIFKYKLILKYDSQSVFPLNIVCMAWQYPTEVARVDILAVFSCHSVFCVACLPFFYFFLSNTFIHSF